jgi:hypothetical protein
MEVTTEPHQYQWITNEGLLRDEGILFGLAGAAIQDKIEAIRDYYRIKKAAPQTQRERLEKEIEDLDADLQKTSPGAVAGENKDRRINLVPATLQLFLYAGICYFNFYLEIYWLSPVLHSTMIYVGLYLFGLFSVFMGRGIMYNSLRTLGTRAGVTLWRKRRNRRS